MMTIGTLAAAVWYGLAVAGTPADLTISIPPEKDAAHVEASYTLTQPYLSIEEGAYSDGVEGGLAGFIEDLTVALADGTSAAVSGPEAGRWNVDAPAGGSVTVAYDVRFNHGEHPWAFGADEVACTYEDSVFFVSRTLLLLPPGVRESRVQIVVPEGWQVATPWTPVEGESFTFDVPNERALTRSCVLAGEFIERKVRVGDTVVELAIGHPLATYAESLESSLRACVPAYRDLFQDAPQARFLAVVHLNPVGAIVNGSAYPNSISMLTPKKLEGANFDQAIYTIAHEVLHLWNGNRMRPAGQMEWFKEGFTDYLTWRTLAEEGLVDERALLFQLRRQVHAYLNEDRQVSIAEAGERKAQNTVLVYEGGSLVALCLDATIRSQSDGERDIKDFMRAIYARSAPTNARYDFATIVSVASAVAGSDLQPFFDQFVNGMDELPLDDCLGAMGLHAERKDSGKRISVTVTPDESATGAAAKARDTFLGRN